MEFEVIKASNSKWDEYMKSAFIYDFHHTPCFHKIECGSGEEPLLFVAGDSEEFIALPLIIKEIPGTDYFDANSVYGYGGPIASRSFTRIPDDLFGFFKEEFKDYCHQNNIISVFSRLHPLIDQSPFFQDFGDTKQLNKIVAIDLTEPVDIQRQHYSRSYKNQINKLKKKKGYVVEELDKENIDVFREIYFETMERVDAKDYYFFSDDYLKKLVDNDCFDTVVLVAYNADGEAASSALYTMTDNIMQYHLGGTKDFALRDGPIKYVMDEARLLGSKHNLDYLSLGGGLGGSDDDSLFQFKSRFSKNFFQFEVWNLILNQKVYDQMVEDAGVDREKQKDFFPLYRAD